ncbi:hypothetical protein [Sphingomonas sp.]|uniref:hypothetical protein n=1 Tax=Sphingomonas sp. TaxID=28214 RepID=UPI003B3B2F66
MASKRWLGQDIALRSAGLALLCLAAFLGRLLFGGGPHVAKLVDYPLAGATFLSASVGSALLWQGRHLFDQVELSSRWATHVDEPAGAPWAAGSALNNPVRSSEASS